MLVELARVERLLAQRLGHAVRLAAIPIAVSPGEGPQRRRRQEHAAGRAAGALARARAGAGVDDVSITHAGRLALAAAVSSDAGVRIGIDYEPFRPVDRRAARLYLTAAEVALAGGDPDVLLRLWTVKEALFKATPNNANLILADFEVERIADHGVAHGPAVAEWRFASVTLHGGYLSVAVCEAASYGCELPRAVVTGGSDVAL